jgi:hypothetical protein
MTRDQTIQSLVRFDQPLPLLEAALRSVPWDWEDAPLAILDEAAVVAVLRRHASGELSDEQVERWADLIEMRDDIDFTPEATEAIFRLANPLISGPIEEVARELLLRLA